MERTVTVLFFRNLDVVFAFLLSVGALGESMNMLSAIGATIVVVAS